MGIMNLFSLSAKLTLDTSEYEKSIKDTEGDTKTFAQRFGGAMGTVGKVTAAGVAAAGAAVAGLTKSGMDSYAQYEQLVGGVETLFGAGGMSLEDYAKSVGKSVSSAKSDYNKLKKAEDTVLKNSEKAFKTAGLSANAYMEQATSTAAALINSLDGDTVKAANLADQAIIDMSDNANKMGTNIESIQNAYNGFAKGNFTMLDNLKLGYGGTKEEMQRLLDKAGEISGYKYDISSYADIVDAIHVVQTEIGITGTTMKEADATISGSGGSIQAAWQNLVTSFGRGKEETAKATQELVDSASTYLGNIVPRIGTILQNIGAAIVDIVPIVMEKLPGIVSDLLPGLLSAAMSMVTSLIAGVPSMIMSIADAVITTAKSVDWLGLGLSIWDSVKSAFSDVWDWATKTFDSAVQAIQSINWVEVGTTVWNWIKGAFDDVVEWVTGIFTTVSETVSGLDWETIGQTVFDAIGTAWDKIVEWVTGIFSNTTEAVGEQDWASIGQTIFDAIATAWSTIVEWVTEIYNSAADAMKEIKWEEVGQTIFDLVSKALSTFGEWAKAVFTVAWGLIKRIDWKGLGLAILNFIKEEISAAGGILKGFFDEAWDKIQSIDWAGLGQYIWTWITSKVKEFASWAQSIFNLALSWIQNIDWAGLGTDIWNGVISSLKDFALWAQAIFNMAWSWISEIDWAQLGKDVWNGIVDNFGDAVLGVAGFFKDLFNGAVDAILEIDWVQFGLDIINAIWEGMKALADWVAGLFDFSNIVIKLPVLKVTRWTNFPIIGDIPTGFGVNWVPVDELFAKAYDTPWLFKDPTVMGQYGFGDRGNHSGGEMVYGRNNLMRDIRTAVSSMSTGGDNITFNVYATPGQDVEELAREIERTLVRWEDQRKAAGIA